MKTNNYSQLIVSKTTLLFVIFFALASFIAALYPSGLNWGFHFLAFYGVEFQFLIPLLMLLSVFLVIQDFFIRFIQSCVQRYREQTRIVKTILFSSLFFGLALLFWFFRVKTFLLGDGQLCLRGIQSLKSVDQLATLYKREPFVGFLIMLLSDLFIWLKNISPFESAYRWLSIFSGISFVIILIKFVRYFSRDPVEKVLIFFLILATGTSQLFFGYVENYPPACTWMLLFLFLSISYLKGKVSISWITVTYVILIALHLGMLIFIPAYIYLMYVALKRRQVLESGASIFLAVLIVAILLQLTLYQPKLFYNVLVGSNQHFVPLFSVTDNSQAYTFFSLSHFVDIVNLIILCCPAAIVLSILSVIVFRKERATMTQESWFMILTALCGLIFIMALNCELGMSRDWDILAPISIGLLVAVIFFWVNHETAQEKRRSTLVILTTVIFLHTVMWVGVNADEKRAVERFELLRNKNLWSVKAEIFACEELAVYFREHGESGKAIYFYTRYIELDSTNRRLWRNLAEECLEYGDTNKAVSTYEKMIQLGIDDYQILTNYGSVLANRKQYAKALAVLRKAESYSPFEPLIKFNIGIVILESTKNYKDALKIFLKVIEIAPNFNRAYYLTGYCYKALGERKKADLYFDKFKNYNE